MTIVWTIVFFAVLSVIIHKIIQWRTSRYEKLLDALPGPRGWPLLGNLNLFFGMKEYEVFGLMQKLASKYGNSGVFTFSLTLLFRRVQLTSAENVSKLLVNMEHLEKGDGYQMISEYIGDGLVTALPKKWRHHREIINTAFTFKMFDNFIRIFNEQSCVMLDLLHDRFDNVQSDDEGFQDLSSFFTRCSLDIILEAACGTKVEAQINEISEIHHAMESGVAAIGFRMKRPWYRNPRIYWNLPEGRRTAHHVKESHDFLGKIVHERIKERREGTVGYSDGPKTFLDILLDSMDADKGLAIKEIIEETVTIAAAGHDTVATAMNFVLFMLATHPNHQRMVQEEIDSIFMKSNRSGPISAGELSQMKYLERCIKETLRLYPTVSGLIRKLRTELQLDNGFILPVGTNVSIFLHVLHRDPKVFPEPNKFDPDRFLPENCVGRHPCAFIPFSAGPRNCIGQKFGMLELKLLVSSVLRDFNVETRDRVDDVKLVSSITVILVNPIRMKLIPRIGN